MDTKVFVVIATSLNRTPLLINRSLLSVYKQTDIDKEKVKVLVVDDNETGDDGLPVTLETNKLQVAELRKKMDLPATYFETFVMPNSRIKKFSGTGAWNTGIRFAYQHDPESCVAILDDDDSYLPYHLQICLEAITNENQLIAVFQELVWQNEDGSFWNFPLTVEDMTERTFFIGNPGIQGSNMFFKTANLFEFGGFDETLGGSTDRDLMIRFLKYLSNQKYEVAKAIKIINTPGVIHYHHSGERITKANDSKHKALNRFYDLHRSNYSVADYQASLKRANKLFNYNPVNNEP